MLFENIEIHNCKELVYNEKTGGYKIYRIPSALNSAIDSNGFFADGVELRFVPLDDEIKITISAPEREVRRAIVFYGNVQAGWEHMYKAIYEDATQITIPRASNQNFLSMVSDKCAHPFSPEVVRVILTNVMHEIFSVEGKCRPPKSDELPQKTYLAYGSSITHGSVAMLQTNCYVSRIGEHFKADVINLGFAGHARLEKQMADYIAEECEFDFATLEMGVNILGIDGEDFRERVRYFVSRIANAHPDKKIFCIDVFYMYQDLYGEDVPECKPRLFRKIVREVLCELSLPNTVYVNGLDVLTGAHGLAQDEVHPNARGHEEMAANLIRIIENNL